MPKAIPVYDICTLGQTSKNEDFLAERLSDYLDKYYKGLHFPHRHSFYHLVLFTNGKGSHSIDFTKFEVTPSQLYFMIPGQVHSWNFEGKTDGYIINFSERFIKSFLANPAYLERFNFFSGNSIDGVLQLNTTQYREITSLLESVLRFAVSFEKNADILRVLLLQVLLLSDGYAVHHSNIPPQKQLLLKNFRKLIDANYKEKRLPKEYADLLYVTPGHLNALCQDLLGDTAGNLIRDRVILEAKRLLTSTNLTAAEIAYELNFEDNSYFNRFFKKATGITPDEFRKQF